MSEPDLLIHGDASDAVLTAHWSARIIDGVLAVTLDASPIMTSTIDMPQDPSCWTCVVDDYVRACISDIERQVRGRYIPAWQLDQMDDPIERARRAMLASLPRCTVHEAGGDA